MGLGHVLFGLVDQPQVLEEGRQPRVALDRRELLGQVEEAQKILTPSLAGSLPEAGAAHDGLGQVEHR